MWKQCNRPLHKHDSILCPGLVTCNGPCAAWMHLLAPGQHHWICSSRPRRQHRQLGTEEAHQDPLDIGKTAHHFPGHFSFGCRDTASERQLLGFRLALLVKRLEHVRNLDDGFDSFQRNQRSWPQPSKPACALVIAPSLTHQKVVKVISASSSLPPRLNLLPVHLTFPSHRATNRWFSIESQKIVAILNQSWAWTESKTTLYPKICLLARLFSMYFHALSNTGNARISIFRFQHGPRDIPNPKLLTLVVGKGIRSFQKSATGPSTRLASGKSLPSIRSITGKLTALPTAAPNTGALTISSMLRHKSSGMPAAEKIICGMNCISSINSQALKTSHFHHAHPLAAPGQVVSTSSCSGGSDCRHQLWAHKFIPATPDIDDNSKVTEAVCPKSLGGLNDFSMIKRWFQYDQEINLMVKAEEATQRKLDRKVSHSCFSSTTGKSAIGLSSKNIFKLTGTAWS